MNAPVTVMETEVIADCYAGPNCDEVKPLFRTYCRGDRESDTHTDDIVIPLKDLPPGARITVEYPACPVCGAARDDEFEFGEGGILNITGHAKECDVCGFDWEKWVLENYS